MGCMNALCSDCLCLLTDEEEEFYEYRCEVCEGLWHERVQDWKSGKPDRELDTYFNIEGTVGLH